MIKDYRICEGLSSSCSKYIEIHRDERLIFSYRSYLDSLVYPPPCFVIVSNIKFPPSPFHPTTCALSAPHHAIHFEICLKSQYGDKPNITTRSSRNPNLLPLANKQLKVLPSCKRNYHDVIHCLRRISNWLVWYTLSTQRFKIVHIYANVLFHDFIFQHLWRFCCIECLVCAPSCWTRDWFAHSKSSTRRQVCRAR